jgi:hypothetical protein
MLSNKWLAFKQLDVLSKAKDFPQNLTLNNAFQ